MINVILQWINTIYNTQILAKPFFYWKMQKVIESERDCEKRIPINCLSLGNELIIFSPINASNTHTPHSVSETQSQSTK